MLLKILGIVLLQEGLTALHFAAYFGYTEIAEMLLNKEANPDLQDIVRIIS